MQAIEIIRLHAMYQRSRKMLIFLSGTFLTVQIACVVLGAVGSMGPSGSKLSLCVECIKLIRQISVEFVLSGTHKCEYNMGGSDGLILTEIIWILSTTWEIIALCLAVWIAVKHFRELRRASTEWAVGDCFTALIETHVFYFAR
jgi:hypothetical protein